MSLTNIYSKEAIDARANQEDPIIMYLIIRESLNMGVGKIAAQAAHAAQMLMLTHQVLTNQLKLLPEASWGQEESKAVRLYEEWLNNSFRKVVLKADDNEWRKVREVLHPLDYVIVKDNGLTEVAPGSETVIGVFPMHKSMAPKAIKKLQALK